MVMLAEHYDFIIGGDPDRDTIDLAILDAVTGRAHTNAFPQKRLSQAEPSAAYLLMVGSGFLSSPCQRPWGHPRSVGGGQDRFCGGQDRWASTRQVRIRVFVCRSVSGLYWPAVSGHFLVALPKPAVEQVQRVSEALARELGVVARALVAAERVLAVHLQPREAGSGVFERGVDALTAFARDVRILAAPDHQQFTADLPDPVRLARCSCPGRDRACGYRWRRNRPLRGRRD